MHYAEEYLSNIETTLSETYSHTDDLGLTWFTIDSTSAQNILTDADETLNMSSAWKHVEHLHIDIQTHQDEYGESQHVVVEGLVDLLSEVISKGEAIQLAILVKNSEVLF